MEGHSRIIQPDFVEQSETETVTSIDIPSDLKLLPLSVFNLSEMQYPLTIPGILSSVFGWRIHPIDKRRKFHTGIDIAAPLGTPVVAAFGGTVTHADWMGGYGKTVIVEHRGQRTLYAHLSEIRVRPGLIGAGMILGEVGTTGNSTGPHLHFELQNKTASGWQAIDPGKQIKSALRTLMIKAKLAVNSETIDAMPIDNQQNKLAENLMNSSQN